ncbi:MAG: universal stress protein [Lewinellaceae bacterium]|nr:universal stress protein [Saprospiraceae bacterium]MCB9339957.1 universal stress protein [Lewinellaceae bacterium]
MKKILFPTDFSLCAENAFNYAILLAGELNAVIDVVNIYSLPFVDATNVPPEYIEQMLEEKRKMVESKLAAFANKNIHKNVGELISVYGIFVPQEISDLVKEQQYDLVVMGTRGEHHSTMEKILGSITTNTMMTAGCPTLAVPEEAIWKDVGHIAFATDFEAKDKQALEQLMAFAGTLSANVHFIHVETKPGIGTMESTVMLANYPYKFSDFAVINSPTVIEGIDRYIHDKRIDILALYIPKRGLWERLFHNSFSKKMAFHTRTPLLIFHG